MVAGKERVVNELWSARIDVFGLQNHLKCLSSRSLKAFLTPSMEPDTAPPAKRGKSSAGKYAGADGVLERHFPDVLSK